MSLCCFGYWVVFFAFFFFFSTQTDCHYPLKSLRFSLTSTRFPAKLVYPHDQAETSQSNQVSGLESSHNGNESEGLKSS